MNRWRELVLFIVTAGVFTLIMCKGEWPQPLEYHNFADQRLFMGIPNFFDVLSNLIFIIVGPLGIMFTFQNKFSAAWKSFFIGILLVGPGSAYYHWNPNNSTLVWDRLPMTIAFMGLFSALMGNYITPRLEKILLVPLLLIGFTSVIYWAAYDDLRYYVFVQAAPLVIIPCLFFMYKKVDLDQKYLIFALISYGLAKLTESRDAAIYEVFINSGHTIKHLLAGVGSIFILIMLKKKNRSQSR